MKEHFEDKELLSIIEVANKISVPFSTVAMWIQERRIPSYHFGRHVRIHKDDLMSWIKNCRQEAFLIDMKELANKEAKGG